jgi:hypothetical protein
MQLEYKGYRITGLDDFAMVKIMPKSTGDIPAALDGYFTKVDIAKQHIDNYLNNLKTGTRRKKGNANATEESASTG